MTADIRKTVHLHLQWLEAHSQLADRSCQRDPVDLVTHYIKKSNMLSHALQGKPLEQHLLRVLSDLIECATDPLAPNVLKQLCLDNLHHPSGSLRTLYQHNPQGLRKLNRIHHSITTLYNHCSYGC